MRALLMFAFMATFASETFGETYDNPHDFLVEAIRTGHASGIVIGKLADLFTQQFKSTSTLLVDVERLNLLTPECARLRVKFTKKDVVTPKGSTDANLRIDLNYCTNGKPPFTTDTKK